jgi:hypothetical protein
MDFEQGRLQMEKLVCWAEANATALNRNEADTRLHLIDQLLFDCLAWRREDLHAEEAFEGTYTDYSFLNPRRFVLEAKREGVYFELPAGFTKQSCKIQTLTYTDKALDAAVRQAMRYCQERSIPLGAVCNGHQLLAFLGSRPDGVPPMEGNCLVFCSLSDMLSHFRVLWDNISRSGIIAYTLHSTLKGEGVQPPPEKLSSRIPGFPVFNAAKRPCRSSNDLPLFNFRTRPTDWLLLLIALNRASLSAFRRAARHASPHVRPYIRFSTPANRSMPLNESDLPSTPVSSSYSAAQLPLHTAPTQRSPVQSSIQNP